MNPVSVEQHNREIQDNRDAWSRKPLLREVYGGFYRDIGAWIDSTLPGAIVEIGSGVGAIKTVLPRCVTTDLFANPWLDRQENAYALTFADGSVSHLILFDVWHHLRYPGTALREFRRVLTPGGRLILFEPAASWTGRFVYSCFHHEPLGLHEPITWDAPDGFDAGHADYFAAQGAATRLFWWRQMPERLAGWRVLEVQPIVSFAYLATGGFSGPQWGGRTVQALARALDRAGRRFPRAFAVRLLVVLERSA